MTGGRDSVCRVWDMRTKVQIHCLTGHDDTVCSILSQPTDPQVCIVLLHLLSYAAFITWQVARMRMLEAKAWCRSSQDRMTRR